MCIRIPGRLDFPAAVNKLLRILCCNDRIHHNRDISAGRIFHTGRDTDAAGYDAVLLILHRTCAYRHIGQQIRQIAVILRIKHLFRAGKSCLTDHTCMHLTDRDDTGKHIFLAFRIRLVKHPLITETGCTRLVGIDSWDDEDLVLDLLVNPGQPVHIIQYRILIVRRTRSYDKQKLITLSAEDICDLRIPFFLDRCYGRIQRKLLFQRLRRGQFPDQLHTLFHRSYSLLPFKIVKIDFIKNQLCIIAYLEQFA